MDKISQYSDNLQFLEMILKDSEAGKGPLSPEWKTLFDTWSNGESNSRIANGPLNGTNQKTENPLQKELQVMRLIQHFRDYGHLDADLDPLKLTPKETSYFKLEKFELNESDLDKKFLAGQVLGMKESTLRELIQNLQMVYCKTITVQIAQCERTIKDWLRNEIEFGSAGFVLSNEDHMVLLNSLTRAESLEKFIHSRFVGAKRFSIEGGDALLPMLETLVSSGIKLGMEELVIGMAHRGRVNVLGNFMHKAFEVLFSEFEGVLPSEEDFNGDVKYHLGYSTDKQTLYGNCHVSLGFNPSHLEAIGPVVCGMVRAKQELRKDSEDRKKVIPLIIHGDSAFCGQGVVSETLQLSQLDGFKVGGTIHIVVNNQVGFTTIPKDYRSSRYSSDLALSIRAPVILVNGDDIEACARAMELSVRFRQLFKQDIVIDLICYRKHGHNESDEPAYTQPLMYEKIKSHPTPRQIYATSLISRGITNQKFVDDLYAEKFEKLDQILENARRGTNSPKLEGFSGVWKGLRRGFLEDMEKPVQTAVDRNTLRKILDAIIKESPQFNMHPKLKKLVKSRSEMWETNALDWSMGELFAYGSIILENRSVRMTGQDCIRGTFSHRHIGAFDEKTNELMFPLHALCTSKNDLEVYNSSLSEMAVLAYEYGFSTAIPNSLTIWEAQFGDFANGAQIIIDQFLSSAEVKWGRSTGLVLLLPHGYEGQGPEHSSGRIERFLQNSAQGNWQICVPTTPAQLFHLLRRQLHRDFRKPLVVFSPKSLLRHPQATSSISDFETGCFDEILDDPRTEQRQKISKLLFCSGKLYYELDKYRVDQKIVDGNLAIVRMEQLYPFPRKRVTEVLKTYPNLKEIIWAQEEPENMGGYFFESIMLKSALDNMGLSQVTISYIGRPRSGSPATGSPLVHKKEQSEIIKKCFGK